MARPYEITDDVRAQMDQRIMALQAIALLEGVSEMFYADPNVEPSRFKEWHERIEEFKTWVWDESPIA